MWWLGLGDGHFALYQSVDLHIVLDWHGFGDSTEGHAAAAAAGDNGSDGYDGDAGYVGYDGDVGDAGYDGDAGCDGIWA